MSFSLARLMVIDYLHVDEKETEAWKIVPGMKLQERKR